MVAQEWSGRALKSSIYFEPDDTGMELFEAYLKSLKHEPVRMLVMVLQYQWILYPRMLKILLNIRKSRKPLWERKYQTSIRNWVQLYLVTLQLISN